VTRFEVGASQPQSASCWCSRFRPLALFHFHDVLCEWLLRDTKQRCLATPPTQYSLLRRCPSLPLLLLAETTITHPYLFVTPVILENGLSLRTLFRGATNCSFFYEIADYCGYTLPSLVSLRIGSTCRSWLRIDRAGCPSTRFVPLLWLSPLESSPFRGHENHLFYRYFLVLLSYMLLAPSCVFTKQSLICYFT